MNFPAAQRLAHAWTRFEVWGNTLVWERTLHVSIRLLRLDLVNLSCFVFYVICYFLLYGWRGALQMSAVYILFSMIALWCLRPLPAPDKRLNPFALPPWPKPLRSLADHELAIVVGTDRVVRINIDGACLMRVRLSADCKVEVRRPSGVEAS